MTRKHIAKVYNTFTHREEEVELSGAIEQEYERTWKKIRYSDKKFEKHEIPFSALGDDEHCDLNIIYNLPDESTDDMETACSEELHRMLITAMDSLKEADRLLILEIFYCGKTEEEIARKRGVSHQRISIRKRKILHRLKEAMQGKPR